MYIIYHIYMYMYIQYLYTNIYTYVYVYMYIIDQIYMHEVAFRNFSIPLIFRPGSADSVLLSCVMYMKPTLTLLFIFSFPYHVVPFAVVEPGGSRFARGQILQQLWWSCRGPLSLSCGSSCSHACRSYSRT